MTFTFTCPHCGVASSLPDESAGQSVSCPSCGKFSSAGSGDPSAPTGRDVQNVGMSPAASGKGRTILGMPVPVFVIVLIVVILFVVVVCGGILIALLLPAIQSSREYARQVACKSKLHNIHMAIEMYRIENDQYPPAYTVDENGQRLHSWRTLLLPFFDEGDLYDQIRLDEPWDSEHNRRLAETSMDIYHCPSHASRGPFTSYVVVVGPGMIFQGADGIRRDQIQDRQSRTILLTETSHSDIHWMEPKDIDSNNLRLRPHASPGDIGSEHPGGVHVAMADGMIHFLPDDTDPKVLRAMLTIDGGEVVELPWEN